MGRPSNTVLRAKEFHAALTVALGPQAKVPRPAWNNLLCSHYQIGIEMAHKVSQTGEALGLWIRHRQREDEDAGCVMLMAQAMEQAAPAPNTS